MGHSCTGGDRGVTPWPRAPKHSHKLALGSQSTPKADTLLLSLALQVIKGTVNIQVGDVNDNAPQFHNQPYSVRIPEVGSALPGLWLFPQWPLVLSGCHHGAGHQRYRAVLLPQTLTRLWKDETSGSYCLKMGRSKVCWVLGEGGGRGDVVLW